ncbi:hypothetical protein QBC46DRAFT_312764 [Diplogelasinospora grovesii]|uniref:HNH nuclease domain-containing protein n=1 Tax=Diplogelasinospora grovesii TaxID=303347 RepID=A0AAN6N7W2_9PEZI|nr:hypothetical protein QBC46DRAFT_312764 [Diplogelasinospora grovesii]
MDWTDPLRKLAPSVSHPAPESVASSELSSVFADHDDDRWYKTCDVLLKTMKDDYIPNSSQDDTPKVLHTFLMKLPKDGQLALMSEIQLLKNDAARLRQLRNFLVDTILKPIMAAGGKNPKTPITPSPYPGAKDAIPSSMSKIEPSFRKDQASLKADCLRREGYRCALTNKVDRNTKNQALLGAGARTVLTQCAHILPFALRNFNEQNAQETENKATIWWALYRYFPDLKDLIGPDSINQRQNALTMLGDLHREFGDFNLALEPLGNNRYRVCWMTSPGNYGVPEIITLTSNDLSIPLPDPKYLWVHFRIAEVLEVSGVGKTIADALEKEAWDPENIEPNGSSDIGSILSRKMLTGI